MKRSHLLIMIAALMTAGTSAALACDQDIYCPVKWVWSDSEGTCVEAPTGTT